MSADASGAPGEPGTPGGHGGRDGSDGPGQSAAEQRVRAALAAGQAPAASDVVAVLDALAEAQKDAEERWQAVMRLAPAAKRHRARAEAATRSRTRLEEHLAALERLGAEAAEPVASELRAWAAAARALLAGIDGAP